MTQVTLSTTIFKKYVKIRYPILIIIFIFITFLIPAMVDQVEWYPQRSIMNQGEYGHSLLHQELKKTYDVNRLVFEKELFSSLSTTDSNLILIIAPDMDYTLKQKERLNEFLLEGGNILILGTTESTIDLLGYFNIYLQSGRIFDRDDNFGESGLIRAQFAGHEFMSVTPYSIEYFYETAGEFVQTKDTSISELEISSGQDTTSVKTIGHIGEISYYNNYRQYHVSLSVIADNWAFSNNYIDIHKANLDFFEYIIENISNKITTISVDESHYDYLPINKEGVLHNAYRYSQAPSLILLISFFTIVIPLLIASRSGLLGSTSSIFSDEKLNKRIARRLETLHIKSVPAVPLSAEERYLVENRLEMLQRKQYYFQFIIAEILQYINYEGLNNSIRPDLLHQLNMVLKNLHTPETYWKLIDQINLEITIAEDKLKNDALNLV